MAILAVIDSTTNELVTTIVAELTDPCPDGCYFVELPVDHTWVNGEIIPVWQIAGNFKQLQVF